MQSIEFYLEDDRYTVPTLSVVTILDDDDARVMAQKVLDQNPHYLGIAVYEGDRWLFGLGSSVKRPFHRPRR